MQVHIEMVKEDGLVVRGHESASIRLLKAEMFKARDSHIVAEGWSGSRRSNKHKVHATDELLEVRKPRTLRDSLEVNGKDEQTR